MFIRHILILFRPSIITMRVVFIMNTRSNCFDLPILVFPRRGIVPPGLINPMVHGVTIQASVDPGPRSTRRPDHKKRGEAAEAAFLARAAHLGFTVLHPWGESNRYDAAIDSGAGAMLRVQVKSAASFHRGYVISTKKANGRVYTPEEIEFIAGYAVPENIWYIIPIEAVGSRGGITFHPHSRRHPKPMFERYREAWCLLDCPATNAAGKTFQSCAAAGN